MTTREKTSSIPGPHDICRRVLRNGIVVLIRENHVSPTVIFDGILRAGAINSSPEKDGLARFTASALMRGAGNRTFSQIFEAIESVGASLSFSAGQHSTDFGGQCLTEDFDLLLDIVRDALYAPSFPNDQLEKLRGQIITGLQIQAHDTRYVASRMFYELAYPPEHPYSRYPGGSIQTIGGITRRDIVNFHHQFYGPEGMVISLVGDIDAEEAVQKLEEKLGGWSAAPGTRIEQTELPPIQPINEIRERRVKVPGKSQSDIILGLPGPMRKAEDFLHARLANTILGVFGLMGRLGKNVRGQQGLAYYAYSDLRGGLGPAPWLVSAGVNPANVSQAIASIRDEIRRLQQELVPADELADNIGFLVGSLPLHLETNAGVSDVMMDMELFGLGLDYLQRYPERISGITAEQILAAAVKYLDPDNFALAVAGPDIPAGPGEPVEYNELAIPDEAVSPDVF